MFSFFNAELSAPNGCPSSAVDIVITPFFFAFVGIMLFVGSIRYEMTYDKAAKWWKWCFAPLGLAVLLGLQQVVFLTSIFYINTVVTKKLLWSHYLALIIPILCIVSIILYKRMKQRNEERRVY